VPVRRRGVETPTTGCDLRSERVGGGGESAGARPTVHAPNRRRRLHVPRSRRRAVVAFGGEGKLARAVY